MTIISAKIEICLVIVIISSRSIGYVDQDKQSKDVVIDVEVVPARPHVGQEFLHDLLVHMSWNNRTTSCRACTPQLVTCKRNSNSFYDPMEMAISPCTSDMSVLRQVYVLFRGWSSQRGNLCGKRDRKAVARYLSMVFDLGISSNSHW